MRKFRLLGLVLMATFVLGAIGATVASAEETGNPEILPVPTEKEPLTFTLENNTKPELVTTKNASIKCEKLKGSGSFTSRRLGVAALDFEGKCEALGLACKAEGDAAGTILAKKSDIHLVDVLENKVLSLGLEVLPLPEPLVISCGGVPIEVRGSAIGLVLVKDLQKTKHFEVHFDQTSTGEQTEKVCILDKEFCEPGGKPKQFLLESSTAGGAFELAAELVLILVLTPKEVEFHF